MLIRDIPIFDDLGSYVHPILGWFTVQYPIVGIGFIIYQVMETEPRANTTGDFIEFNIGVLAKLLLS